MEGTTVQGKRVVQSLYVLGAVFSLVVPLAGQELVHQAAVPMIINAANGLQGTGVIIGPRTVLSVQHVVAPQLAIQLADGRMIRGSPVCVESADIGIIIASEYFPTDTPIYSISLRVPHPDDVVTIPGYPHGVWTVKTGRVRWTMGALMAINIAIAPGNSGSPVIDATGSVVGIASRAGSDLAIATPTASIEKCARFLHLPGR